MTQAQLYPLVAYMQQYPINKEHVHSWGKLIALNAKRLALMFIG